MINDRFTTLADAEIGTSLSRPVLVSSISESVAKNGKTFVRMTIKDGVKEQTATMFDTSVASLELKGITKETIADVILNVNEYQGSKNFIVNDITIASDPSLSINDFIKVPPVKIDVMYDEIISILRRNADDCGGKHTPLSELAIKIIESKKDAYTSSSAAVTMHHNLKGGLIYHSYRMVKAAETICEVYNNLDKELMVCGAALHDIGKIWEYDTDSTGNAEFTVSGVLFGHLYMGASLIKKNAEGQNYSPEKIKMLTHMILAHHGELEYGAVVSPAIAEAFALYMIDNLDAKMYVFDEQRDLLGPGGLTEKRPFGMENRIYVPDL